jgi:hypothetical protein
MSVVRENAVGFLFVGLLALGMCAYAYAWSQTHVEFQSCADVSTLIDACRAWGRAEMVSDKGVLLKVKCASRTLTSLCIDGECFGAEDIYRHGDPVLHLTSACEE